MATLAIIVASLIPYIFKFLIDVDTRMKARRLNLAKPICAGEKLGMQLKKKL